MRETLPPLAFETLAALGLWLYKDVRVFTQTVRALRAHLEAFGVTTKKNAAQVPDAKEAAQQVKNKKQKRQSKLNTSRHVFQDIQDIQWYLKVCL